MALKRLSGPTVALLLVASTVLVTPGAHAQIGGLPPVIHYEETWDDGCSDNPDWILISPPPAQFAPGATGWGTTSSGGVGGTAACHNIIRSLGSGPTQPGYAVNANAQLLTASPLSLVGKTVTSFQISVKGVSTQTADQLHIEMRVVDATDWTILATRSGTVSNFETITISDPGVLQPFQGTSIEFRARFVSDDDPEVPPLAGWTVDNFRIYVEPPINTGGDGGDGGDPDPEDPPQTIRDFVTVKVRMPNGVSVDREKLDLIADQGRNLVITIDHQGVSDFLNARDPGRYDPEDTFLVAAKVALAGSPSINLVFAENKVAKTFTAVLPVNHPDLTVGDWTIQILAWRDFGPLFVEALDPPLPLKVEVSTMPEPLSVWLAGSEGQITVSPIKKLGRGDRLDMNLTASKTWPQLQKLTYQLSQGNSKSPERALEFPYTLDVGILSLQGSQQLAIRAYDRARPSNDPDGTDVAKIVIPLVVDTLDPVFTVTVPDEVFQGLPFDVQVDVVEQSAFSTRVRFNKTDKVVLGTGSETVFALGRSANVTGQLPLLVEVIDEVGNRASKILQMDVKRLRVDTVMDKLERTATTPLLSGDLAAFRATASQVNGKTAIPADIVMTAPGFEASQRVQLEMTGTKSVVQGSIFPPGRHTVTASVGAPAWITETNTTNQALSTSFEVFLGRVVTEDETYHIRVNEVGTPASAVNLATDGETYDLTIAERFNAYCQGSVFVFTVGVDEYCWDPLSRTTDFTADTDETDTTEDEDSPGLGLVLLLAALGASAAVLRRRQR